MIELILVLITLFGPWIGIAELMRWKLAWAKQRPVLTYFLAFWLTVILWVALIPFARTP